MALYFGEGCWYWQVGWSVLRSLGKRRRCSLFPLPMRRVCSTWFLSVFSPFLVLCSAYEVWAALPSAAACMHTIGCGDAEMNYGPVGRTPVR